MFDNEGCLDGMPSGDTGRKTQAWSVNADGCLRKVAYLNQRKNVCLAFIFRLARD